MIDLAPYDAVPASLNPLEDDMPTAEEVAAAVWGFPVHYGSGEKGALQVLADVPKSVWAYPVNRSSGQVPAIQELADAKTAGILLQAQVAALADALAKVAAGSGLTADGIMQAAKTGAEQALAGLTLKSV